MKTQLHVLTRPADDLVRAVIEGARESGLVAVDVADLTQGEPDYGALLDRILAADAVATW